MAKRLKQLRYSPLRTNASMNRDKAVQCWKAGMSTADIAREWPKVFNLDVEGKLGQIYDSEIVDGSGRLETRFTITQESVNQAIARHKAKG